MGGDRTAWAEPNRFRISHRTRWPDAFQRASMWLEPASPSSQYRPVRERPPPMWRRPEVTSTTFTGCAVPTPRRSDYFPRQVFFTFEVFLRVSAFQKSFAAAAAQLLFPRRHANLLIPGRPASQGTSEQARAAWEPTVNVERIAKKEGPPWRAFSPFRQAAEALKDKSQISIYDDLCSTPFQRCGAIRSGTEPAERPSL